MKGLRTSAAYALACALTITAVAMLAALTGGGPIAAAGAAEVTTPALNTDDRWSYYGGREDAAAFSKALTARGTAAEPDVQYVWGRWECCLNCGEEGAAAFAKPGTMLMETRGGEVVSVRVCCGSGTVELEPSGASTLTALWR